MASSISILGFGAFGQFMAKHLANHRTLLAFDREDRSAQASMHGARWCALAEAAAADIIILAVPVQHLEALARELRPLLDARAARGGSPPLVIDVASVKVRAAQFMLDHLPNAAGLIGTHPLFGPQSGKDGIADLPIALCPVRASTAQVACVRAFLADTLKLRVIDTTPDEHDRQMAYVQGLTHLVSRAIGEMPLPTTPMATAAYERFQAMRENLQFDSWELFVTIQRENPHAPSVRAAFAAKIAEIEQRLTRPSYAEATTAQPTSPGATR